MAKLYAIPITLKEANDFVTKHHRHHQALHYHKFSIGAEVNGNLVGVCIVNRPVARLRDDGRTLEVVRLCTDGTRNVCSFLYAHAARAAFALGYSRIGTYTLPIEGGGSLRAAGWKLIGERGNSSWNRPNRARTDKHPVGVKLLWEAWDE